MTETANVLLQGLRGGLARWAGRDGSTVEPLYWVLQLQLAETGLEPGASTSDVLARVPAERRDEVAKAFKAATSYFDDIRYVALEPVTQVWGTVVNAMRVAAKSNRATAVQKQVFDYAPESVVKLFGALRADTNIADGLHRAFGAMPAPECQAIAALLNVDMDRSPVRSGNGDNVLDVETMVRLVQLLDHEGPMTPEEQAYLSSITPTQLVDAAFTGLRSRG